MSERSDKNMEIRKKNDLVSNWISVYDTNILKLTCHAPPFQNHIKISSNTCIVKLLFLPVIFFSDIIGMCLMFMRVFYSGKDGKCLMEFTTLNLRSR